MSGRLNRSARGFSGGIDGPIWGVSLPLEIRIMRSAWGATPEERAVPGSSELGKVYTARTLGKLFETGTISRVTDVGAGSGTYRRLLAAEAASAHWTAVEVWEPYVEEYALEQLYDEVFLGPVRDFDFIAARPDLVLFGDVIEHMTKDEAVRVVSRAVSAAHLGIAKIMRGQADLYPNFHASGIA
jgi:hypothetical protein